jgi:integrase
LFKREQNRTCSSFAERSNLGISQQLPDPSWISKPLERWIKATGITFHCFQHTFATLQLTNGTDIYAIGKMLGHTKFEKNHIIFKFEIKEVSLQN